MLESKFTGFLTSRPNMKTSHNRAKFHVFPNHKKQYENVRKQIHWFPDLTTQHENISPICLSKAQ